MVNGRWWPARRGPLLGLVVIFILGTAAWGGTAGAASQKMSGGAIHIELEGSASSNTQSIVITGAFADAGTFTEGDPLSKVSLSRGSFMVNDEAGAAHENALFSELPKVVDPTNCGMSSSYTAPVKLLDGTGSYTGIRGTITVSTRDSGVFPKLSSGKCNLSENATPIGFLSLAQGSGDVSFA